MWAGRVVEVVLAGNHCPRAGSEVAGRAAARLPFDVREGRAQSARSQPRHAEMNVLAASLTAGLTDLPSKNHVEDDAAEAGNRAKQRPSCAIIH